MCISPNNVKDRGLVACHDCWQCRGNRVNDLVGRCIAEQQTSSEVLSVTLTYAGDTPNSAVLVYADIQKFLKKLRRDTDKRKGYKVRYICAGEYGSAKGRAHWHIILFFKGAGPNLPPNRKIHWPEWEHGFCYVQTPDYDGFRYVLKYTLKDQSDQQVAVNHLAMSKKPPLGSEYLINLAEHHAEMGIAPRSPQYTFRGVYDRKGKLRKFWLQGRMAEIYRNAYVRAEAEQLGKFYSHDEKRGHHFKDFEGPQTELMQKHEDRAIAFWKDAEYDENEWRNDLDQRRYAPPPEDSDTRATEVALVIAPGVPYPFTLMSDGTVEVMLQPVEFQPWRDEKWHAETEAELAQIAGALGLTRPQIAQISEELSNCAAREGLPLYGEGERS